MNAVFGLWSSQPSLGGYTNYTSIGLNQFYPQYKQYLKHTHVPKPAKTWLIVDEHPDSINDGYFSTNPSQTYWNDIPASYHSGACGFSFADGHSEPRKWRSGTSVYPVTYASPINKDFDAAGRADYAWYLERTGFVLATNGAPQFGY
jgi:prepilin-type processing-associated H-X9-DG protein